MTLFDNGFFASLFLNPQKPAMFGLLNGCAHNVLIVEWSFLSLHMKSFRAASSLGVRFTSAAICWPYAVTSLRLTRYLSPDSRMIWMVSISYRYYLVNGVLGLVDFELLLKLFLGILYAGAGFSLLARVFFSIDKDGIQNDIIVFFHWFEFWRGDAVII